MENFKDFISDVIDDMSIEDDVIASEIDNFNYPMHIVKLKEVLSRYNIPNEIVEGVLNNLLFEKDSDDEISDEEEGKKKERAKRKGLEHQQYGIYVDRQGNKYKWDDTRSDFVKTSDDGSEDDEKDSDDDKDKKDSEKSAEATPQKKLTIDPKGGLGKGEPDEKESTPEIRKEKRKKVLRNKDSNLVKKQIVLGDKEPQDKGGAGTPESRTGETVTVYAGIRVKELMESGIDYEQARAKVEEELLKIASGKGLDKEKGKPLLTKEWIQSGLNCLDWIENNIGLDELEDIVWDTPEGNELVGSTDHGTSADMFVKTKDGKTIGISLKKDFKVFIVNGGYATKIGEFGEMLGIDELPEDVQIGHYMTRRSDVMKDGIAELNKSDVKKEICNTFKNAHNDYHNPPPNKKDDNSKKVFGKAAGKRLKQVALKKLGISDAKFKKLNGKLQKQHVSSLTCDDLYDHVINDPDMTASDIKLIANVANVGHNKLYKDLRALDDELSENLYGFLQDGENAEKFKDLVKTETHMLDVLFGAEQGLDKLEVLFGEDNGVTMSPNAVANLFGLQDLYNEYNAMEDGDEKDAKRQEIEDQINDKLVITKNRGKPVISVKVKKEDGTPYEVPIFGVSVRSRAIGASPTLEISQSAFGSLAFKNGNVNIETWPPEDKKKVSDAEAKSIMSDIEDEQYDLNDIQHIQEIKDRLEWVSKLVSKESSYIKKLRKTLEDR